MEDGMLTSARMAATSLAVVCVLTGVLAGCRSQAPSTSAAGSSSPISPTPSRSSTPTSPPPTSRTSPPPTAQQPIVQVVQLSTKFSPAELRLGAGQKFQLHVNQSIQATIAGIPQTCPAGTVTDIASGLLSARCGTGGTYLFTAQHSGSAVVSATVGKRCKPGTMCPDFVVIAQLKITIT
jgi:hypothetical protein